MSSPLPHCSGRTHFQCLGLGVSYVLSIWNEKWRYHFHSFMVLFGIPTRPCLPPKKPEGCSKSRSKLPAPSGGGGWIWGLYVKLLTRVPCQGRSSEDSVLLLISFPSILLYFFFFLICKRANTDLGQRVRNLNYLEIKPYEKCQPKVEETLS